MLPEICIRRKKERVATAALVVAFFIPRLALVSAPDPFLCARAKKGEGEGGKGLATRLSLARKIGMQKILICGFA